MSDLSKNLLKVARATGVNGDYGDLAFPEDTLVETLQALADHLVGKSAIDGIEWMFRADDLYSLANEIGDVP